MTHPTTDSVTSIAPPRAHIRGEQRDERTDAAVGERRSDGTDGAVQQAIKGHGGDHGLVELMGTTSVLRRRGEPDRGRVRTVDPELPVAIEQQEVAIEQQETDGVRRARSDRLDRVVPHLPRFCKGEHFPRMPGMLDALGSLESVGAAALHGPVG